MTRLEQFLKTKPWLTVEGGPIGTARVTSTCTECSKPTVIELGMRPLTAWADGELIQNCFPHLNMADRELLISSTCQRCWDEMWKEDDDS